MKLNDIKNLSKDDILSALGLQEKPSGLGSVMGPLGLLGLGLIVGAGAALMIAPRPGRQLRKELSERLNGTARRLADSAREGLASVR
jgi:hypothetical protein